MWTDYWQEVRSFVCSNSAALVKLIGWKRKLTILFRTWSGTFLELSGNELQIEIDVVRCTRTEIIINTAGGIRTYCRWRGPPSGRIWPAPSSARGHLSLLGQRHVINQPSSPNDSFLLSRAADDKWPESGPEWPEMNYNEFPVPASVSECVWGLGWGWPSANTWDQQRGQDRLADGVGWEAGVGASNGMN